MEGRLMSMESAVRTVVQFGWGLEPDPKYCREVRASIRKGIGRPRYGGGKDVG